MVIPDKFKEYLLEAAGASDTPLILDAIQNSPPTISIRINPLKRGTSDGIGCIGGCIGDAPSGDIGDAPSGDIGDAPSGDIGDALSGDIKVRPQCAQCAQSTQCRPVPWCKDGYYLSERPVFTLDPALHAGAYYVQEPSSMFLAVLEPVFMIMKPRFLLDLCASPGGKTTHLVSMLRRDAMLAKGNTQGNMLPYYSKIFANEVIKTRVASLKENVIKWGDHSVEVTSRDARDFTNLRKIDVENLRNNYVENLRKIDVENLRNNYVENLRKIDVENLRKIDVENLQNYEAGGEKLYFDFILVDAPCSGEGMFRKDPSAVNEWTQESVKICAARQKRILTDIWGSLRPGGLLAYSTCTFNKFENDCNIAWLKNEFDAEVFDLYGFYKSNGIEEKFNEQLVKEWGIMPTKEGGFQFFPGLTEGEGFFFALVQKPVSLTDGCQNVLTAFTTPAPITTLPPPTTIPSTKSYASKLKNSNQLTSNKSKFNNNKASRQNISCRPTDIPEHQCALSLNYAGEWPSVELSKDDALKYLSRNTIKLDGAPLGYLRVTYNGLGLGFVKNLGNRANNLYPMSWRIRMDIKRCSSF